VLEGHAPPLGEIDMTIAPRRTVLDALLVDAAREAGAEVREGFRVDDVLFDGTRVVGVRGRDANGTVVEERARVTIGADGLHSMVARAVGARAYVDRPSLTYFQYAYWEGLDDDELGLYLLPRGIVITFPTNDGAALLIVGVPVDQAPAFRHDLEGEYLAVVGKVARLAPRLPHARRVSKFVGTADLPNRVVTAGGPGWALVGDARSHRDPIIAEGISCGFRDAEVLAAALDDAFTGALDMEDALARYQQQRDEEAMPWFELTCQLASFEVPPEFQAILGALTGNQPATNDFFGVIEGTVHPADFFAPERVRELLQA
jgi:flavin-dependent dehydrogenase